MSGICTKQKFWQKSNQVCTCRWKSSFSAQCWSNSLFQFSGSCVQTWHLCTLCEFKGYKTLWTIMNSFPVNGATSANSQVAELIRKAAQSNTANSAGPHTFIQFVWIKMFVGRSDYDAGGKKITIISGFLCMHQVECFFSPQYCDDRSQSNIQTHAETLSFNIMN